MGLGAWGRLRPWVGLWFGPRAAKAGAGELEASETEVFADGWPRGRASSKSAGALPCSLFFVGLGSPEAQPLPRALTLGPPSWVQRTTAG